MVPAGGLAPTWFQIEDRHQPAKMDLAELEDSQDQTIAEPTVPGNQEADKDNTRPKVLVQKLLMIPKAWAPYFLEPQSPWKALQTYKMLIMAISEELI
jgi:hypothetical protein